MRTSPANDTGQFAVKTFVVWERKTTGERWLLESGSSPFKANEWRRHHIVSVQIDLFGDQHRVVEGVCA
jgi:hypothetical protein